MANKEQGSQPNYSEIEQVTQELTRQAEIYLKYGIHSFARMDRTQFLDAVTKLVQVQPESAKKRFDLPLLVVPFYSVYDQFQYVRQTHNLRYRYDAGPIFDLNPRKFKTPRYPYLAWLQTDKYANQTPKMVKASLEIDERGATACEAFGYCITQPNIYSILEEKGIFFPGTYESAYHGIPLLTLDGVSGVHDSLVLCSVFDSVQAENYYSATCFLPNP